LESENAFVFFLNDYRVYTNAIIMSIQKYKTYISRAILSITDAKGEIYAIIITWKIRTHL